MMTISVGRRTARRLAVATSHGRREHRLGPLAHRDHGLPQDARLRRLASKVDLEGDGALVAGTSEVQEEVLEAEHPLARRQVGVPSLAGVVGEVDVSQAVAEAAPDLT